MICEQCATAADTLAAVAADMQARSEAHPPTRAQEGLRRLRWRNAVAVAQAGHGRCTGCTCQHRTDRKVVEETRS